MKRRDASGFSDKTDIDGDGDIYELETYGGGGNGGYAYGTGTRGYTTSSSTTSGFTSSGYYSSSVSYTYTTNGSTTSISTSSTYAGSYGYGGYGGSYSYTMSLGSLLGGRGMQNPAVRSAVLRGQAMHKQMDYGPGVEKEQKINARCRVDGIDRNNHIIYELKPDNPRAIARGKSQLDRYVTAAREAFGGTWQGKLVLY